MTTREQRAGRLEVRSIDYVPLNERHGKIWHLGPLWFIPNAQIATPTSRFFVGLPVAGLLYYAFTRSVDVAAETRVAEAEAAELERAAEQHRTS